MIQGKNITEEIRIEIYINAWSMEKANKVLLILTCIHLSFLRKVF